MTPLSLSALPELQRISKQTFQETFAPYNSAENMEQYITHAFSTEKLQAELQNHNSQFYFAYHKDEIAGYIKLNSGAAQTENMGPDALEIERIYVLQQYQGKNLGQQLFNSALRIAAENNKKMVWLGVWEHNTKAISFYLKNGFVVFSKHQFKLGNDVQTDLLMKKST